MKSLVWIINQSGDEAILISKMKRIGKNLFAHDSNGNVEPVGTYTRIEEAIESFKDFLNYLSSENNSQVYKIK